MQTVHTYRGYHFNRNRRRDEDDDEDDDDLSYGNISTSENNNNYYDEDNDDVAINNSSDNVLLTVSSINNLLDAAGGIDNNLLEAAGIDTSKRSILSSSSLGGQGRDGGGAGVRSGSPRKQDSQRSQRSQRISTTRIGASAAAARRNRLMSQTAEEIFISKKNIISNNYYDSTKSFNLDCSNRTIGGGGIGDGGGGTTTTTSTNNKIDNGTAAPNDDNNTNNDTTTSKNNNNDDNNKYDQICDFTTFTKKIGGIIDGKEVIFELREAINDIPKISKSQRGDDDDDSTRAECINVQQSPIDLRCKWYLLKFGVPQLTLGYISCVLLLNFVFAALWYSIHSHTDGAKCCDDPDQTFLEVFDFAIQTSFTIGKWHNIIY